MRRTRPANATPPSSPRSVYRKIGIVLAEARRGSAHSLQALAEQILHSGHRDFKRPILTASGRKDSKPCSEESVLRVVSLCVDLGFLSSITARLTSAGIKATASSEFNESLKDALKESLLQKGVSVTKLKKIISDIFSACRADVLPTWDTICERLDGALDQVTTRTYLGLLASSGGIAFSRKKIYLPE